MSCRRHGCSGAARHHGCQQKSTEKPHISDSLVADLSQPLPACKEVEPLDLHPLRITITDSTDAREIATVGEPSSRRARYSGAGRVKQLVADYESLCRRNGNSGELTAGDVRRQREHGRVLSKGDACQVPSGKHVSGIENETKAAKYPSNSCSEKDATGSNNSVEDGENSWVNVKDSDLN